MNGYMDKFMNQYFGALGKESCVYFYVMSIIFGISFVMGLISFIAYLVANIKKLDKHMAFMGLHSLITVFLVYFVNRLLHTMCVNSTA